MIVNLTTGYPLTKGNEAEQLKSLQNQFCSLIDELNYIIPMIGNSIPSPVSGGEDNSDSGGEV